MMLSAAMDSSRRGSRFVGPPVPSPGPLPEIGIGWSRRYRNRALRGVGNDVLLDKGTAFLGPPISIDEAASQYVAMPIIDDRGGSVVGNADGTVACKCYQTQPPTVKMMPGSTATVVNDGSSSATNADASFKTAVESATPSVLPDGRIVIGGMAIEQKTLLIIGAVVAGYFLLVKGN